MSTLSTIGIKRAIRRIAASDSPRCPDRACAGELLHAYTDDGTHVDGVYCPTCGGAWLIDDTMPTPVAEARTLAATWRWPRRHATPERTQELTHVP